MLEENSGNSMLENEMEVIRIGNLSCLFGGGCWWLITFLLFLSRHSSTIEGMIDLVILRTHAGGQNKVRFSGHPFLK